MTSEPEWIVSLPNRANGSTTSSGGIAGLVVRVAMSTALAAFSTGLLGASVAGSTGSTTAGILIRGVPSLVLVLLICRALARRATRSGEGPAELLVIAGAGLGFLLDPLTWVARTAVTQVLVDPGIVTLAGDLLLWLGVAVLGARWGSRDVAGPAGTETPYG
jgi:hypothetical protein